jgi:hypothetical protein
MAEESEEKEKKGLFHKFKAFKRRSVLIIASKIGGAENTVDEAYDDQHEAFLKVQSEMKDVKLACEQTIKSMEQFVAQNLVVAEKFSTMLPQDGQFYKIGLVRRQPFLLSLSLCACRCSATPVAQRALA